MFMETKNLFFFHVNAEHVFVFAIFIFRKLSATVQSPSYPMFMGHSVDKGKRNNKRPKNSGCNFSFNTIRHWSKDTDDKDVCHVYYECVPVHECSETNTVQRQNLRSIRADLKYILVDTLLENKLLTASELLLSLKASCGHYVTSGWMPSPAKVQNLIDSEFRSELVVKRGEEVCRKKLQQCMEAHKRIKMGVNKNSNFSKKVDFFYTDLSTESTNIFCYVPSYVPYLAKQKKQYDFQVVNNDDTSWLDKTSSRCVIML